MTRTLILLSLIILVITACMHKGYHRVNGSYNTVDADADCEAVYQMVQKRWYKHDVYNCYYYDKKLINAVLKHKNCFIGKDTAFINDMFGKSKIGTFINFRYNVSSKCSESDHWIGEFDFRFQFEKSIINNINFRKNTVLY